MNLEMWSHLLKGHNTAKGQNQAFGSDMSDFKAIPWLLHGII